MDQTKKPKSKEPISWENRSIFVRKSSFERNLTQPRPLGKDNYLCSPWTDEDYFYIMFDL